MSSTAHKYNSEAKSVRKVSVGSSNGVNFDTISIDYARFYNERLVWKRILDLIFGAIGVVILAILYPFIALGIKFSSNGPIIFKQERTGFDGEVFNCYKFRTMHTEQKQKSAREPDITEKNDARIFPFAQFLRKTNLDEIPQFINVLKGDMSLVGPRPYPIRENSYWNTTLPEFYQRFSVKPGLTGLAQAYGLRGGTLSIKHMRERLNFDLKYIKKRSLYMDLKLIFLTFKKMVTFDTEGQ